MTGTILDSWKAVSQYLHFSVRTCQRLEREAGLPIHRIDDTPKARVYAYTGEIDRWLERSSHHHLISPGRRILWWAAGAALTVLAAAAFLAIRGGLLSGRQASLPARAAVSLVVLPFLNDTGDAGFDAMAGRLQRRLMVEIEAMADGLVAVARPAVNEALEALGPVALKDLSESDLRRIMKRTEATHLFNGHFWREAGAWALGYDLYRPKGPPVRGLVKGGTDEAQLPALVAARLFPALSVTARAGHAGLTAVRGDAEDPSPLLEAAHAAERAYTSGCDRKDLLLAIGLYRQAIADRPGSAAARFGLGHCLQNDYLSHGGGAAALEAMTAAYAEALRLAPELPEAQIGMGWAQLFGGRRDEAYAWFVRARDGAPSSPEVNYHVGCFLGHIGLAGRAVFYLTRAIDLGERSIRAYRQRAYYRAQAGELQAAAEDSARLCEMAPTNAKLFAAYGSDLMMLRDLAGAERELEIAEVLAPQDWDVKLLRAVLGAAQGGAAGALETVRAFREASADPSFRVAAVEALLGRAEEAVAEIRAALELNKKRFQRSSNPYLILSDPRFVVVDRIRSHPAFRALLDELRAEQADLLRRYGGL